MNKIIKIFTFVLVFFSYNIQANDDINKKEIEIIESKLICNEQDCNIDLVLDCGDINIQCLIEYDYEIDYKLWLKSGEFFEETFTILGFMNFEDRPDKVIDGKAYISKFKKIEKPIPAESKLDVEVLNVQNSELTMIECFKK